MRVTGQDPMKVDPLYRDETWAGISFACPRCGLLFTTEGASDVEQVSIPMFPAPRMMQIPASGYVYCPSCGTHRTIRVSIPNPYYDPNLPPPPALKPSPVVRLADGVTAFLSNPPRWFSLVWLVVAGLIAASLLVDIVSMLLGG